MTTKRKAIYSFLLFILVGFTTSCSAKSFGLVIHEYRLAGEPDISTEHLQFKFANGNQETILARTESYRDFRKQILEYNNSVLAPLGYRQENYAQPNSAGYSTQLSDIYHGDEKIVSGALYIKPVLVNKSGNKFITEVETFDGTYALTSHNFQRRAWPPVREPYTYVAGKLLSVETISTAHQELLPSVYLDDKMVFQSSMFAGRPTYGLTDGPWSYDGHWALVLLDGKQGADSNMKSATRVIQDGQDLNTKYGYEQSFQFAVLGNRPFYFFQKDGKINISFDGKDFLQGYEEIPHYNCCSPALLNPGISMNMIWFFAHRGNDWYYVEAYVPTK